MIIKELIDGVHLTRLKIIELESGNVLKGLKNNEKNYHGFGEAYFSKIKFKNIKGWSLHKSMTLNLLVPEGRIRFVMFDDRLNSKSKGFFNDITLSEQFYFRLTVPPYIWVAFQGLNKKCNILLNIANIIHDPNEVEKKKLEEIAYDW